MLPRAADTATSHNMELDAVLLSQSLSQFKKSDVTIESNLLGPENLNGELKAGEQGQFRPVLFLCFVGLTLFPKTHSQEALAGFSSRERHCRGCARRASKGERRSRITAEPLRRLSAYERGRYKKSSTASATAARSSSASTVLGSADIRSKRRTWQAATARRPLRSSLGRGTAASSGVGAVSERERSGARGCAGGAGIGTAKGPGGAARGGARDVTDAARLKGASCESACCPRRTITDLREQAECPGRGARSATHGC